jgi:hypothetical protein
MGVSIIPFVCSLPIDGVNRGRESTAPNSLGCTAKWSSSCSRATTCHDPRSATVNHRIPRTNCSITWPQAAISALVFLFAAWLIRHGEDVRPALTTSTTALAAVLLLTSVRITALRTVAWRVAGPRPGSDGPLPGLV